MDQIAQLISEFGFPVVLALGMGYFIFFVWKFITTELKPQLGKASTELIRLLDQIRMLDNDLIRLQQKVDTVLEYNETQKIVQEAEEKKALKDKMHELHKAEKEEIKEVLTEEQREKMKAMHHKKMEHKQKRTKAPTAQPIKKQPLEKE